LGTKKHPNYRVLINGYGPMQMPYKFRN